MTDKRRLVLVVAGIGALVLAGSAIAQTAGEGRGAGRPGVTDADWFGGGHHGPRGHRGHGGPRGGGHRGWGGPMGGMGPMGMMMGGQMVRELFEEVDVDKDGRVTQAEIDAFVTSERNQFDANRDGMTLDEFQGLFLERMRTPMVRAFQFLDRDGDGKVSEAEFSRPVDDLVERMDRDGDGALSRTDRGPRGRGGRGPDAEDRGAPPPAPPAPGAAPQPTPPASPQ